LLEQRVQHIPRELSVESALLDECPFRRGSKKDPHFSELARQQFAEQRPDAHVRVKVATFSNARPPGRVVASHWIV
jgi:hypothetical protein